MEILLTKGVCEMMKDIILILLAIVLMISGTWGVMSLSTWLESKNDQTKNKNEKSN